MTANLPVHLCDACRNPGQCCQSFHLSGHDSDPPSFWLDEGDAPVFEWLKRNKLPFLPLKTYAIYEGDNGRKYRTLLYRCPVLQPNGRCGDYANRPELCRSYKAGSDGLCAMFQPEFV